MIETENDFEYRNSFNESCTLEIVTTAIAVAVIVGSTVMAILAW